MQEELARLRHDGGKQTQRGDEEHRVAGPTITFTKNCGCVDVDDAPLLIRCEEEDDHADQQAHITNTVGEEGLKSGIGIGLFFPPMADERKRADAHKLPTNNHLQHVRAGHKEQHGGGKQRQETEVVGEAAITSDIVGAVDVHQHRDEGDHDQQRHGQAIDHGANGEVDPTV